MQDFSRLVDAQAPEEAQLDHLRFARRQLRQRAEGIVEGHEIVGGIGGDDGCGIERDVLGVGAPFDVAAPRMVNEDPAHRLGRNRKEMRAVLPVHALVIDQPHVGFVDERRCLKAVAGALAFHVAARQAAELLVHNRRQLGERALVPSLQARRSMLTSPGTGPPTLSPRCIVLIGQLYAAFSIPSRDRSCVASPPMSVEGSG